MAGKHRIDKRIIAEQQVKNRAIIPHQIEEKLDRFFKHRLPQIVVELWEPLPIDRVVFFKAPKIEPVAA